MTDVDPQAVRTRDAVESRLLDTARRFGYQQIDTPVLEHTELFLRKSGGERVAQMYAFHFRDRDLSLRPEFTASALRFFVDSMQSSPLPVRLSYAGPVFRYERPQAGRTRQFTDVGVELIGGTGSQADAEVIHLAIEGLRDVGIAGKVTLGHIGIVLSFLDRLPLRQRARDWLLWSMDRLQKGHRVDIEAELPGLISGSKVPEVFHEMRASIEHVPADQIERWILAVLREVGVQMHGGTRSPEEIVSGVVAKMHQTSDDEDVRRAFSFISELVEIRGAPGQVLPEIRKLVRRHGLEETPIREMETTLELLSAYSGEVVEPELNLGLGRGLHYYTGILFEIYSPEKPWLQLCGGGRYDELAQSLGARQPIPACGFSYGLERVVEASGWSEEVASPDVLVVQEDQRAMHAVASVASRLRSEGMTVEVDVRCRSAQANRRYAFRRGIAQIVTVSASGEFWTEQLSSEIPSSTGGAT